MIKSIQRSNNSYKNSNLDPIIAEMDLLNSKIDDQSELLNELLVKLDGSYDKMLEIAIDDKNETPLSVNQLAESLGKSPSTIRRWEREGLIHCERIPNSKQDTLQFYLSEVKAKLSLNMTL